MPTLATAQGKDFVPRLGELLGQTVEGFRAEEARDIAKQKQADITSESFLLQEMLSDPNIDVTQGQGRRDFQASMLKITQLDPVLGKTMQDVLKSQDEQLIKNTAADVEKGTRRASFVNQGKTTEEKRERWRTVVDSMIAGKEPTEEAFKIAELDDDQFELRMFEMQEKGRLLSDIFKEPKLTKFKSDEGIIDSSGNVLRVATPDGVKMDFKSKDREMFTGESIDLANKSGKSSDLKFRPEFIAAEKAKAERDGSHKFAGMIPVKGADGRVVARVTSLNSKTGEPKVTEVEIAGKGESVVSRQFGETRKEQTKAKVEEKTQLTRAELLEEHTAAGRTKVQARDFVNIDTALDAAENLPELRQTLKLLGNIMTGGTDAAKIKFLRAAGLEGADLAELTFNLRKNVLKQLKPTFGAAFTEREGKLLSDIEASEDKSTDGNIRLIQRAIERADRALQRGIRSATRQGDKAALDDIKRAIKPFKELANRPLRGIKAKQRASGQPVPTGKFTKDGKEIFEKDGKKFTKQ